MTGLPQRYQDSVEAIQPGLPLFLYNYSTRCMHGVFEVQFLCLIWLGKGVMGLNFLIMHAEIVWLNPHFL
jgi:hypothetical protein